MHQNSTKWTSNSQGAVETMISCGISCESWNSIHFINMKSRWFQRSWEFHWNQNFMISHEISQEILISTAPWELFVHFSEIFDELHNFLNFLHFQTFCTFRYFLVFWVFLHFLQLSVLFAPFASLVAKPYRGNHILGEI